jgi:hypothetical protein
MELKEFKRILLKGESESFEFKTNFNNEVIETIRNKQIADIFKAAK